VAFLPIPGSQNGSAARRFHGEQTLGRTPALSIVLQLEKWGPGY
jgi:hypothetical protein